MVTADFSNASPFVSSVPPGPDVEVRTGLIGISHVSVSEDGGVRVLGLPRPEDLFQRSKLSRGKFINADQANAEAFRVAPLHMGPHPVVRTARLNGAIASDDSVVADAIPAKP